MAIKKIIYFFDGVNTKQTNLRGIIMENSNYVVDIKETKREDGNYELVFVLQNGAETDPIVVTGGKAEIEKLIPKQ